MLRYKETYPLSNEPSNDYVGLTGPELNPLTVGLWLSAVGLWLSAVGLFLGRKSKISHDQNVIIFQFYIRLPNFRHLSSIMKKNSWQIPSR